MSVRGLGASVRRAQQQASGQGEEKAAEKPKAEARPVEKSVLLSSIINGVGNSYSSNSRGRRKRDSRSKSTSSGQQPRYARSRAHARSIPY
jgi:hypothetical protein